MDDAINDATPGTDWQSLPVSLPAVGILEGLSSQSLQNLSPYGENKKHAAGEIIIAEGSPQDRLYIVVQGCLEISVTVSGQKIILAQIGEGESIGEVSLLEPGPASATVQVLEEAILWSLDINALQHYFHAHASGGAALMMGFARVLSQRLRQANGTIAHHHLPPSFSLPHGERVEPIMAPKTEEKSGFFGLFKRKPEDERRGKISSEIKL